VAEAKAAGQVKDSGARAAGDQRRVPPQAPLPPPPLPTKLD